MSYVYLVLSIYKQNKKLAQSLLQPEKLGRILYEFLSLPIIQLQALPSLISSQNLFSHFPRPFPHTIKPLPPEKLERVLLPHSLCSPGLCCPMLMNHSLGSSSSPCHPHVPLCLLLYLVHVQFSIQSFLTFSLLVSIHLHAWSFPPSHCLPLTSTFLLTYLTHVFI